MTPIPAAAFWLKSKTLASPIIVPFSANLVVFNLLLTNFIFASFPNPIAGVPFKFVSFIDVPTLIGTLWFSSNLVVLGFNISKDEVDTFSIS